MQEAQLGLTRFKGEEAEGGVEQSEALVRHGGSLAEQLSRR